MRDPGGRRPHRPAPDRGAAAAAAERRGGLLRRRKPDEGDPRHQAVPPGVHRPRRPCDPDDPSTLHRRRTSRARAVDDRAGSGGARRIPAHVGERPRQAQDRRRRRDERPAGVRCRNAARRPAVSQHERRPRRYSSSRRLLPGIRHAPSTASTPTDSGATQTVDVRSSTSSRVTLEGDVGGGPPRAPTRLARERRLPVARGYFNSAPSSCRRGADRRASTSARSRRTSQAIRWTLVQTRIADQRRGAVLPRATGQIGAGVCDPTWAPISSAYDQDMNVQRGSGNRHVHDGAPRTHPQIATDSRENAFAIQVRLRRTSVAGIPPARTIRRRLPQQLPLVLLHGEPATSATAFHRPARRSSTLRSSVRSWATSSGRRP